MSKGGTAEAAGVGDEATGAALRDADKEKAREAARMLGSIRTPRKIEQAKKNLERIENRGKPPQKDPLTLPCTCGAGSEAVATFDGATHKTTCPRGRLLYQRAKLAAKRDAGQAQEGGNP